MNSVRALVQNGLKMTMYAILSQHVRGLYNKVVVPNQQEYVHNFNLMYLTCTFTIVKLFLTVMHMHENTWATIVARRPQRVVFTSDTYRANHNQANDDPKHVVDGSG
jgi:hypothetical protein